MKTFLIAIAAACLTPITVRAVVSPVTVTGFNQDIVVDNTATGPDLRGVITATMDAGTAETGGTFYQNGFVPAAPSTGLPTGTVVTSTTGNGTFQLALATENNALLLNNTTPTGLLTLATPTAFSELAFYDATGNGSGSITYTLNFVGGLTQTGTFTSPDWFGNSPIALTTSGRVNNVVTGTTDNVGGANPRVYEHLITVSNTATPLQSVSFSRATANGNTAILAISGNAIPEPTSTVLLTLAGIGLLARRRGA